MAAHDNAPQGFRLDHVLLIPFWAQGQMSHGGASDLALTYSTWCYSMN